ncbi:glycosyltransferase [Bacillus velezensis]|uniref:tetratricopeptide repeat-containing glycosyltransferase n=1 Tax=Bacillus TaxID=1386 RepID=UPI0013315129|nr:MULTISPECIES: glycosyltransferase [Bacillus amyloliquefaciens group]NRF34867.1 glycosyltransferase [Bacillus velezensis]
MKISACILAKNEELHIEECILSIREFVDEIIVIDNGSCDSTNKIAADLGCKVITVEEGIESELRNEYLKIANGDWILTLDADERVTKDFGCLINKEIRKCNNNIWGFRVPMYNYYGDGKWSSIITCRVFKNTEKIYYAEGDIHPTIADTIYANGKNLGFIPSPIHHLDALIKDRTPAKRENYINKIKKTVQHNIEKNNAYRLINYLGVEYTALNRYKEAEECFITSAQKDMQNSYLSYLYLAQLYILEKKLPEARIIISKILDIDYKEVLKKLNFNITESLLEDIKIMVDDITQRALVMLAEIEVQNNNFELAEKYCLDALNIWPFASHLYLNAASLTKDREIAKKYIEKAVINNPFLKNKVIYTKGYTPNIYRQQTSLLSSTFEIINELKDQYGIN